MGSAAVHNDNKPSFLRAIAKWVQDYLKFQINFENFSLTRKTACAFVRTLLCNASLIEDLFSEVYGFVLTSRLQSDPLKRRDGQYRQMSVGRFLIGLIDTTLPEKIIKIKNLLNERIDIDRNVNTRNEGGVENRKLFLHDFDTLIYTVDTISSLKNGEVASIVQDM